MIPDQWYVVLESREVKRGRLLGVTRMGERLLFARDRAGKAFCLRDRCAHRGASLSAGTHAGDAVACPFHGFRYDATGRGVLIPANGRNAEVPERFHVHAYPVYEAHGWLWIWWGERPPARIAGAPVLRGPGRLLRGRVRSTRGTRTTRGSSRTSSTSCTCRSCTPPRSGGATARW